MKRVFWNSLGFASLSLAYIGLITPGLPYSIWIVFAAYCFSKGSPQMHKWLYNHKVFGPFLTNWQEKKVFPTTMKFFMLCMMSSSIVLLYLSDMSIVGITSTAIFMLLVAVWAWRYPGSVTEWEDRVKHGKKIGWFK